MNEFISQFATQVKNPYAVFFFIAYALSLFMFHMTQRRRILATKFVSDSNYALYYFLMGGLSGAMGSMIAGLGGLTQALTPDKYMAQTKYYRLSFAIVLSSIGIHFSSGKATEMLPLIGIILGRLAEMSMTSQKVRVGMILTFPLWMYYNFSHEYWLLLFANTTALMSLSYAIWRNRRVRYVAEPV